MRFAPDSDHVLYTSGYDARLLVVDTRQPAQQQVLMMARGWQGVGLT